MSRRTREVHVGVDVSATMPDTWRLFAECADEQTDVILMGKQLFDVPNTEDALLASGFAEMLLAEHQARCASCQRWAARA